METTEHKIKEEFAGDYYMKKKKAPAGLFGLFGSVAAALLHPAHFGGSLVT